MALDRPYAPAARVLLRSGPARGTESGVRTGREPSIALFGLPFKDFAVEDAQCLPDAYPPAATLLCAVNTQKQPSHAACFPRNDARSSRGVARGPNQELPVARSGQALCERGR